MDCFGDTCGSQAIACSLIATEVGKAVRVAHVVADIRGAGSRPGAHFAIGALEGVSKNDQMIWGGEGRGGGGELVTMEKMAVVAPMPRASIRMAVMVNPGDLRSWRKV